MRRLLLLFALLLTTLSYGRMNVAQPTTAGVSSWYGRREQGRQTAYGERFDRHQMTCASRLYPKGTLLLVRYPKNGTFVVVRVNDRGPWVTGRILDLSEHAAQVLGLKPNGIGYVTIEPLHILWREQ